MRLLDSSDHLDPLIAGAVVDREKTTDRLAVGT